MLSNWMMVAVGGAVGALLRYAMSENIASDTFPWATLTANLLGSFALGVVTALVAASLLGEQQALLLGVGLLGSFTTLSTFSVETAQMVDDGRYSSLGLYIGVTGLIGPMLALAGWKGTAALLPVTP
jgi:CrcB protein